MRTDRRRLLLRFLVPTALLATAIALVAGTASAKPGAVTLKISNWDKYMPAI